MKMKKEISFLFKELITFADAFPQTISLVWVENHVKRTKLPIQSNSEKNTKIILNATWVCFTKKVRIVFIATSAP